MVLGKWSFSIQMLCDIPRTVDLLGDGDLSNLAEASVQGAKDISILKKYPQSEAPRRDV